MNEKFLNLLFERYPELGSCRSAITAAAEAMIAVFEQGGTFFCCGNGGSAADCDHICGELLKGFMLKHPLPAAECAAFKAAFGEAGADLAKKLQQGLRAVSLLSHPGYTSAFANDVDANLVYAQQLHSLGRKGDLLLSISTGGNSTNVLAALRTAKLMGIRTILLTGNRHGLCESCADCVIAVPESETYRIQERHLPIYHALCQTVEAHFFQD